MAAMHDEACLPDGPPGLPERPGTTLASLFTEAIGDPTQRVTVIGGLVCLALFCMLFRDNLWHFYYAWTTDENYSHGFLVPLLSLYFANQVVQRGPVPIRSGVVAGGHPAGARAPRAADHDPACRSRSWATWRC